MSSSLCWKPVVRNDEETLPDELKRVISKKLWGTDGSCGGESVVVGSEIFGYLAGLMDSGIDGADELIELISTHGQVELWHG